MRRKDTAHIAFSCCMRMGFTHSNRYMYFHSFIHSHIISIRLCSAVTRIDFVIPKRNED